MNDVLVDIIDAIREQGPLDALALGQILNRHNKLAQTTERAYSKKQMLPYFFKLKERDEEAYAKLGLDDELEAELIATLRMKPRRTASGVATITVITKPHACSGHCMYCPNDVRMPKSYLHKEPACQRAERNYFDPFLQVSSRLRALKQMGHTCDKIELIVLGGSWTDYPVEYQTWFMTELFRALNEAGGSDEEVKARRKAYRDAGIDSREEVLEQSAREAQTQVDAGELLYNDAVAMLYGEGSPWAEAASWQQASMTELEIQQGRNELSDHRVVGLVVETRPEAVSASSLERLRRYGCTKVQIGVQSLRPEILKANHRSSNEEALVNAFELLRIFGFKLHAHFMVNLYGSTPEADKEDYERFVSDAAFVPDEVKLYPCVLVEGTGLVSLFEQGAWSPYDESELIEILAHDIRVTPPFTRVSRMIRDISAEDIVAGSKKTNLRQMVEASLRSSQSSVQEIRYREIAGDAVETEELQLVVCEYPTVNTRERFLSWVTDEMKIAGFLRLSFPDESYVQAHRDELPRVLGQAMIREVHVYGQVANLHKSDGSAQHRGLGQQLVERASEMAREAGFTALNVISSVGTREYYRKLGFEDGELYQTKRL